MKFSNFILIILLISSFPGLSQKFQLSVGSRFQNTTAYAPKVGNVVVKEITGSRNYFPIGLHFEFPLTQKIDAKVGARYFDPASAFLIYEDTACMFCPVEKVGIVSYPTIEMPLSLNFQVLKFYKFRLKVYAELTPSLRISTSGGKYEGPVNPPGWTQNVIDVYNDLPNTVKKFYFNYGAGLRIHYLRFELSAYLQRNMSNLAFPLLYKEGFYFMDRNVMSLNLSLSYTFWRLDH